MDRNVMTEEEFLSNLNKIALKLKDKKEALSDLRRLERKLDLTKIYDKWSSSEIKFLAYFTKQIIEIIWRNLAVDTSIELSDSQLKKLSEEIGLFLTKAISKTDPDKIDESFKIFSNMIDVLYSYIIEADKSLWRR